VAQPPVPRPSGRGGPEAAAPERGAHAPEPRAPAPEPQEAAPGAGPGGPASPVPLGRLGPLVFAGHLSWALPANAAGTLLQALFAEQRADSKVAASATLTTFGALASIVATVAAGALSDHTRSRHGRRNPWILGGALVAALGLSLSGVTPLFAVQVLGFAVFQAGIGAMLAALYAILPDRVATSSLGRASALGAVGYLVGTAIGGFAAAAFIERPALGMVLVPWTMVVAAVLIVVLARDRSNLDQPRERLDVRGVLRSLVPPDDTDYRLAFVGRLLVIMALFVIAFYQLYLLTDVMGVSTALAGTVIAAGTTLLGVAALLAALVTGVVSDRQGRRKPLAAGASALVAVATVPLIVHPSIPTLFVFAAVAGLGYGAFLAVDGALMVEVLPGSGSEARDLGVLSIANSAPVVLGPVVAALTVTLAGYRALFVVSAALAAAGALCIARIRRVR
jgi:MFS family permease